MHLPAIAVVLPHAAAVGCASAGETLPPRLQARLVELSAYGCTYEVGDGAWAVGGAVPRLKGTVDVTGSPDVWEHEDIWIRRPTAGPRLPPDVMEGALRLHFDGACKPSQRIDAGGFIA